eukprot:2495616-Pyramimonas_sp.AAC.1
MGARPTPTAIMVMVSTPLKPRLLEMGSTYGSFTFAAMCLKAILSPSFMLCTKVDTAPAGSGTCPSCPPVSR